MEKEKFVEEITKIPGIGKVKAEALFNAGYDSIDKIREAPIEDLAKVKGIGENLAKKIKEEIEKLKPEEKPKKPEEVKPKKKPKLSEEVKRALELKKEKKIPEFRRQEWFRYKRLGESWRRPKGLHSKYRRNLKYRPKLVRIGFRTPKAARGLHPSGFEEVLVYNVKDLEKIDPDRQAARIGRTVGTRKRMEIISKADELGIKILNRGGV